jgi:regulator of cell morphogenesis and NO signaling
MMPIAESMTVGELAATVPGATREFERLGIDYCCGGTRTLDQACAEANLIVAEVSERLEKCTVNRLPADRD